MSLIKKNFQGEWSMVGIVFLAVSGGRTCQRFGATVSAGVSDFFLILLIVKLHPRQFMLPKVMFLPRNAFPPAPGP